MTQSHDQMTVPIHFIDSKEFHEPDAWNVIMVDPPPRPPARANGTSPLSQMALPPLTHWEQMFYFRRMNFLLFQAEQLRTELDGNISIKTVETFPPFKETLPEQITKLVAEAIEVRNLIVRANLGLISVMNKHRRLTDDIISNSIVILFRCVDIFNYSWGLRFSTLACRSLQRARRVCKNERFFRAMMQGSSQIVDGKPRDLMAAVVDCRHITVDDLAGPDEAKQRVAEVWPHLKASHRDILALRYGLNGNNAHTLEGITEVIGTTKENVRQRLSGAIALAARVLDQQGVKRLAKRVQMDRQLAETR